MEQERSDRRFSKICTRLVGFRGVFKRGQEEKGG